MGAKNRSATTITAMAHRHVTGYATGDGAKTEFALPRTVERLDDVRIYVGGIRKRVADTGGAHDYQVRGLTPGYSGDKNMVKFTAAPAAATDIVFDVVGG